MRRLAILTFLISVVALGAWKLLPFWTEQAPTTDSTPVATPLADYGEIKLKKGDVACVEGVTVGPRARYLRFLSNARRAARVRVAIISDPYRIAATSTAVGQEPLTFPIRPPRNELADASACLSVSGRQPVSLLGIPYSRLTSDSYTTVNGKRSDVNATLAVLERTGSSRVSSFPATLRHAGDISPIPTWVVWVIMLVASVGIVAALAYGIGQSAEDLPARADRDVEQPGTGP